MALHKQGLQRIRLADGHARFWSFDQTARSGALMRAADATVIYEAKIDDLQAEFGTGTAIGQYQAGDNRIPCRLPLHTPLAETSPFPGSCLSQPLTPNP